MRRSFREAGVDLGKPVVASCGSGVSAAILVLAMETLGKLDATLYDGSWAEYASSPDNVIEDASIVVRGPAGPADAP